MMPSMHDNSEYQRELMRKRKAKLIAKGLDPRSLKFMRLLYRR